MFSVKRFSSRRPSQAAALQALEPRRLFATSAVLENGILTINGTDAKETILIEVPGRIPKSASNTPVATIPGETPVEPTQFNTASGLLEVNFGNNTPIATFDPAEIRRVIVRAGDGNDEIILRGAALPKKTKFDIQGSDGIDSLSDTYGTYPKVTTKPDSTIEIIRDPKSLSVGKVKATFSSNGILTFTGSSANDDIDFRDWGASFAEGGIAFTINGTQTALPLGLGSVVSKVVIKSGGGDDLIKVDRPGGASNLIITVDGGAGKDTVEQSSDIPASRVETTNTVPRLNQT